MSTALLAASSYSTHQHTQDGKALRLLGIRHLQAFILFLCMAVNYLMRVNISTAIVMMTAVGTSSDQPVFDWSMVQQSTIMSSFHIGYLIMNLGASVLVTKFQNKSLLFMCVASSSIVTLAAPILVISGGFYVLLALRILLGLLQGPLMAVVMGQLSRWIPPNERSRCGSLVLGGINFGNMISFGISGWIGDSFGWPSIFYFSGCTGVIWSILWAILAADSPKSCWLISEDEKAFIEEELILTSEIAKDKKIPWRGLFSNTACWALLLTTVGHNWGNWTLLNEMPSYFNSILHLDSTANGLITALPHGCLWLFSFFSSYISDMLIKKRILSVGACRKICNTIGQWGPAAALLILSYTVDQTAVFIIYTIGVTLLGFVYIGYNINHLDIVPSDAGFFMGITNGASTITSFGGTEFAGIIVTDPENKLQWRIVFGVSAGIFFLSNLIFLTFGSGEVQAIEVDKSNKESNSGTPTISVGTVVDVKDQ
nr:putative inorganic phosphate cotransporter isoform X2 [Halyomorpha halys]